MASPVVDVAGAAAATPRLSARSAAAPSPYPFDMAGATQTPGNLAHPNREPFTIEDRWTIAETRFVELFFGPDIAFRSRHEQHLKKQPIDYNQARSSSPTPPTLRLVPHVTYPFRPFPKAGEDCVERDEDDRRDDLVRAHYHRVKDATIAIPSRGKPDEDSTNACSVHLALQRRPSNGKITRPPTAELSPGQRRRLRTFRVLDTLAFSRARSLNPPPQKDVEDLNSATAGRNSSVHFAPSIPHPKSTSTRLLSPTSRAGKLLMARGNPKSSVVPARSSAVRQTARPPSSASSTHRYSSAASTRSASTIATATSSSVSFRAPDHRPFEPTADGFFTPALPRPQRLSRAMRTLLVGFLRPPKHRQPRRYCHRDEAAPPLDIVSLHSHLHPPAPPRPGPTLRPDLRPFGYARCRHRLQVPPALLATLNDPAKKLARGGVITVRRIVEQYLLPRTPRVGGRITPSKEMVRQARKNTSENPVFPGRNTPIFACEAGCEAGCKEDTGESEEEQEQTVEFIRGITSIKSLDFSVTDVGEMMNATAAAAEGPITSRQQTATSLDGDPWSLLTSTEMGALLWDAPEVEEVEHDPISQVGRVFPLDAFWDMEDLERYLYWDFASSGPIRCCYLRPRRGAAAKGDGRITSEKWLPGRLVAADRTTRRFLLEQSPSTDAAHRPRRHPPIPLWLTRDRFIFMTAEEQPSVPTPRQIEHHGERVRVAQTLRGGFEARTALEQATRILCPLLSGPWVSAPPISLFKKGRGAEFFQGAPPTAMTFPQPTHRRRWGVPDGPKVVESLLEELKADYAYAMSRSIVQEPGSPLEVLCDLDAADKKLWEMAEPWAAGPVAECRSAGRGVVGRVKKDLEFDFKRFLSTGFTLGLREISTCCEGLEISGQRFGSLSHVMKAVVAGTLVVEFERKPVPVVEERPRSAISVADSKDESKKRRSKWKKLMREVSTPESIRKQLSISSAQPEAPSKPAQLVFPEHIGAPSKNEVVPLVCFRNRILAAPIITLSLSELECLWSRLLRSVLHTLDVKIPSAVSAVERSAPMTTAANTSNRLFTTFNNTNKSVSRVTALDFISLVSEDTCARAPFATTSHLATPSSATFRILAVSRAQPWLRQQVMDAFRLLRDGHVVVRVEAYVASPGLAATAAAVALRCHPPVDDLAARLRRAMLAWLDPAVVHGPSATAFTDTTDDDVRESRSRLHGHAAIAALVNEFVDDSVAALHGFLADRAVVLAGWVAQVSAQRAAAAATADGEEGSGGMETLRALDEFLGYLDALRAHAQRVFRDPLASSTYCRRGRRRGHGGGGGEEGAPKVEGVQEEEEEATHFAYSAVRGCFVVTCDSVYAEVERVGEEARRWVMRQVEACFKDGCEAAVAAIEDFGDDRVPAVNDDDEEEDEDDDEDSAPLRPPSLSGAVSTVRDIEAETLRHSDALHRVVKAYRIQSVALECMERHLVLLEEPELMVPHIRTVQWLKSHS